MAKLKSIKLNSNQQKVFNALFDDNNDYSSIRSNTKLSNSQIKTALDNMMEKGIVYHSSDSGSWFIAQKYMKEIFVGNSLVNLKNSNFKSTSCDFTSWRNRNNPLDNYEGVIKHFQSDDPPNGAPDSAFTNSGNLKHFE